MSYRSGFLSLTLLALVFIVAGCSSGSGEEDDPAAEFYGTWRSNRPELLGLGGTTWHSYHTDGTLFSQVNIVDPGSGCRFIFYYQGRFEATADTFSVIFSSGRSETAQCTDESLNAAEAELSEEELAQAISEDVPYRIEGDTLTILPEEGPSSTHTRLHG